MPTDDEMFRTLQGIAAQLGELTGTVNTYMESRKQTDDGVDDRILALVAQIEKVNVKVNKAFAQIGRIKYTAIGIGLAASFAVSASFDWIRGFFHIAKEVAK